MLIIPLGLVSKTRSFPIATVIIAVVTTFYSITHFPLNEDVHNYLFHDETRKELANDLKKHLYTRCEKLNKIFCASINKMPTRFFVVPSKLEAMLEKQPKLPAFNFIIQETNKASLQASAPEIYQTLLETEIKQDQFFKQNDLLSENNVSLWTSFRSLLLHGGYMHLIANMLILIFLAFPVEERLGSGLFTATYLLSGIAGSGLYMLWGTSGLYLVGASTAVSGVAGALSYFFWRNHAKVWVTFFFMFSQVIIIPVFLYSPLFFILNDVAGSFNSHTSTAHLAHLFGFGAGCLLAFAYQQAVPLPRHFTYPFEMNFLKAFKDSEGSLNKAEVLSNWLHYAPVNLYPYKKLTEINKIKDKDSRIDECIRHFTATDFPTVYSINKHKSAFYRYLPLAWLSLIPSTDDPKRMEKLFHKFIAKEDFTSALKVNLLILRELKWNSQDWQNELVKLISKTSTDQAFKEELNQVALTNSNIRKLLQSFTTAEVHSA